MGLKGPSTIIFPAPSSLINSPAGSRSRRLGRVPLGTPPGLRGARRSLLLVPRFANCRVSAAATLGPAGCSWGADERPGYRAHKRLRAGSWQPASTPFPSTTSTPLPRLEPLLAEPRESGVEGLTLSFTPDLLLTLAPLGSVSSLENYVDNNSTYPENE